ncbi:MAG: 3-dehydroquinate synthase [Actinobacteria bacterium]|nr:3-dehydroquinate synthase [Actinomycetota bacterium]NCZ90379.1 3-dehydroquinate synthase [Actinomycetota bacterium]NCZ92583.1 3-dehydroquinate synthase [Actinomycetota bacterium]
MTLRRERVELGDRSYDVVIGDGAIGELGGLIPKTAVRAVVVTQQHLPVSVQSILEKHGLKVATVEIGDGEEHKSLASIEKIMRVCATHSMTRGDVIVGVGGGMVTDVAGYAAASWHRGIAVVHVSTTLVGMVDAAIGGKTGVNIPEGKNLVGAFWQPSGVVCDTSTLTTLPERERRCGYGEMAKYHFLTGDDLLAMDLPSRIARCVRIKADIVSQDEREGGLRAVLNYGHTLGHALEIATHFSLAHGEAVAVGLKFAALVAHSMGRIDASRVAYHDDVIVKEYGLSVAMPTGLAASELVDLMKRDKKSSGGLTFMLDGPRGIEMVRDVPEEIVLDCLKRMELR